MKKFFNALAVAVATAGLSACGSSNNDYLADITKDTHSGCFSASTNYMGFTQSVTYIHLGDNSTAVNASPSCAGITQATGQLSNSSGTGIIPSTPAPVGKASP